MQCIENFNAESYAKLLITAAEPINGRNMGGGGALLLHHSYHEICVWQRTPPSAMIFIIYAFVVPVLAFFGLCANFINAIVFMRPKMTPSAFSYLAALSWLDCISCFLITLTAFSRSIFYTSTFWLGYDFQWQTPLFGITTGAANLILACVSFDRLVYLRNGIPNGAPRFCRRKVARRMIAGVITISIVVNMPYFFVFIVNKDGTFQTTQFYYSHFYKILNWFTFVLLAVLPAIFLLIGNAAIIVAFRRWTKQSKLCQKHCKTSSKTTQKRYQHQMKLTITILIVITLYLIGELPAHLTSRKSALNLLFGGDISKVDFSTMERMEVICITLNALQLSMNIIVYAVINPSFMPEFFLCLRSASDNCFRLIGWTAIGNCWRRRMCQRKEHKKSENYLNNGGNGNTILATPKMDFNERENGQQVSSTDDSWGGEDDSFAPVTVHADHVEMRHTRLNVAPRTSSRSQSSDCYDSGGADTLRIDMSWKRSSSLGEFAFDNIAMSMEAAESDEERRVREQQKRHSLAI